ncbi:Oidioi.mRNA.OKI2018_I69.XSR.g15382.t1.cds [Oikopleura dioica]|uniref:Oidioi.mRNA.OKI2018_I69.XSR.g15382.t1.cds n=1 Tax=Oikopleura dioica TaxID=34765 RepID=A0ABN7SCP5_OIKDI|nr:Oidioi.mRNA.OKI2018_I69.XSR.g15382.t1.cds [Oikopleura dioica]
MEWLQRKRFSIRDFFSGTDNSEPEAQNRPISSRRRRTKSGGSRISAGLLSGDETGSEAYATEYEVIVDAAEESIRAIRERVRRQREEKEHERKERVKILAREQDCQLLEERTKWFDNEENQAEKTEREGRSQQRESSRSRSSKPASRSSKSLPPVPRHDLDRSPTPPRLSAKDTIKKFELGSSEDTKSHVGRKKKQRALKLRPEEALNQSVETDTETAAALNFRLFPDIYIYEAEVLVKVLIPPPIPTRRQSRLRKRAVDKSSLDAEPQSESNSETSSLPQPKPRRKSRPRSRPRSRSLSAERVRAFEKGEAKIFETQRRMSLPQISRPLPAIPEFPSTENVKVLDKQRIDDIQPMIDTIGLLLGKENFCESEKPNIDNWESDDEPCCSKHIQRKREWQHEREILLARCKATENSQQVLRNVRGILEQLRAELKREEAKRNELEKEFIQQRTLWMAEMKQLHETIYEFQRTEKMWIEDGGTVDSRVSMLHKKVQELRHEKCQMAKAAERERLNYEEQKNQLLQQIHLLNQGKFLSTPKSNSAELNSRLDNALEQIETVSRQLCSTNPDQQNTLQMSRQISSSTSRLDELTSVRPKSSFDLVRRERSKEFSRDILSDAADLTTDDENKVLPGLHQELTIKPFDKSSLLFGSRGLSASRNVPGLNGPIPWGQSGATASGFAVNGTSSAFGPSPISQINGQAPSPTVPPQTQSIQMQNLRNMSNLSLQGSFNPSPKQVATPKTPIDNSKNVRFGENKQGPSVKLEARQGHERAFDSDDGEARRRREMRMKRFKQLEAKRNAHAGETTDDGGHEEEPVPKTRRSRKYARSKTDTSASEMRAFASKSRGGDLMGFDKPKVLQQFERKLMENEHRQTSRDSNPGLIERDLVGSQISNRTQTAQPRRQSNPTLQNNSHGQSATANNIATQPKPVQSNGIPKSESAANLGRSAQQQQPKQSVGSKLSTLQRLSRFSGSTPNLTQTQEQEIQRGFDCSVAERTRQLRQLREKTEKDNLKRADSLRDRISIFESSRDSRVQLLRNSNGPMNSPATATANAINQRSPGSVARSQSLKMAPTFLRNKAESNDRKSSISDSLAERRSMVAGILSAGPPSKDRKYRRADTQPIESTSTSQTAAQVSSQPSISRPSGPANRRRPTRWRGEGSESTAVSNSAELDDFNTID